MITLLDNLTREIDFQEVQEAQRFPKKLDPRNYTPKHIIITLSKIKDKERILKTATEKERVTWLISQKKPCRQEGAGKKYSKS